MHSHSRRTLLSQLLVLQPGREVTRDVVEAAIWQTVGWEADPRFVGRLLSVIDAYVDARVRRMVAHATGGSPPEYTAFGMPDRAAAEALAGISRSGIARPASAIMKATAPPSPPPPPPPPRKPVSHPAIIPDDDPEATGAFFERAFQESGGVVPFPGGEGDDEGDELGKYTVPRIASNGSDPSRDPSFRRCTWCKEFLPLTEFWKNKRGPKGLDWQCRNCKGSKKSDKARTA